MEGGAGALEIRMAIMGRCWVLGFGESMWKDTHIPLVMVLLCAHMCGHVLIIRENFAFCSIFLNDNKI